MRKTLSLVALGVVIALLISSGTMAYQNTTGALDLIFVVDSDHERSSYLEAFKNSIDELGVQAESHANVRYGLINLGATQEDLDQIAENGFLLTSDFEAFKTSLAQVEVSDAELSFDRTLELIFTSNVSLRVGSNLCIVYLSDSDLAQVTIGDGAETPQNDIVKLKFAVISQAANDEPSDNVHYWLTESLTTDADMLYRELVDFCGAESSSSAEITQPEETESDSTESAESKTSLDLISTTLESLSERIRVLEAQIQQGTTGAGGTPIEGDVESILQNHSARLELLDQNVTALSAHLLNVPVLEDLSEKVNNAEQVQADLSVSIVLLQDRVVNVEGYSERLDQVELNLTAQNQQLGVINDNASALLAQLTSLENNFGSLPIADIISRIGVLEQTTSTLGVIEASISTLQSDQVNTLGEIDALRQLIDALPMDELSQQILAVNALHNDEIGQARDQITIINGQLANLKVRIASNEALIGELDSRITNLPFEEINAQLTKLSEDLQVQRNTDGMHEVELSEIQKNLADLNELVSRVDNNAARIAPLETLPNRVASLERNHRESAGILATQRTSLDELEMSMDDLSSLLASIRNDIDMLRSDTHSMDLRMMEMQTQQLSDRATFGSRLDLATEALARAQSEINNLQASSVTRNEFMVSNDVIAVDNNDQNRWLRELDERLAEQANEIALIRSVFSDLNTETKIDLLASLDVQNRKLERDVQQLRSIVVYMGAAVALSLVLAFYVLLTQ